MQQEPIKKTRYPWIVIAMAVAIFVLVVAGYIASYIHISGEAMAQIFDHIVSFNNGWVTENGQIVELPYRSDGTDQTVVLHNVLPEIERADYELAISTRNQYIRVELAGECVYESGSVKEQRYAFGCCHINLDGVDTGKEITIFLTSPYRTHQMVSSIEIGSHTAIWLLRLLDYLPLIIQTMLVIICAVLCIVMGTLLGIKNDHLERICLICACAIFVTLWTGGNLLTGLAYLPKGLDVRGIALCALLFAPAPFTLSRIKQRGNPKRTRQYQVALVLFLVMFVMLGLLHRLRVLPIETGIWFYFAALAYLGLLEIYYDSRQWVRQRSKINFVLMISTAIIFTFLGVALVLFYTGDTKMPLYATVFVQFYLVVKILCLMQVFLAQLNEMAMLREEVTQSRISLMLSQIRPHFIFNTLNTINYLCKTNPEQAAYATMVFAKYLRANLNSLELQPRILFAKELEHIESYVEIEKIRFGEKINVSIQTEEKMFLVPSLSIQPLVENAIKHGITKRVEGGCVSVSSWRDGDLAIIEVEDNGVGFEPERVDEQHSKGLNNIRERLRLMPGSEMKIESYLGMGTKVTVKLRYEK